MSYEPVVFNSLREASYHCGLSHESIRKHCDRIGIGTYSRKNWLIPRLSLDYMMWARSWAYGGTRV